MEVAMVEAVLVSRYGPLNGCVCVCVWTDTAKLTDMVIARFGDR